MDELTILYEDNHIIVVLKPQNVPSCEDESKDRDMLTIIKDYIKKTYNKQGNVYLGLVHRLDRPTGGVMVFAKTTKAAQRLSKDICNHDFQKEYLAVVEGTFQNYEEVMLKDYLLKDEKLKKSFIDPNGKEAILYFTPIKEKNNKTLIKVRLITGRFHQIRAQLSNIGHPLYGDVKYGSKYKDDLALQAYKLTFNQPITKEKLTFSKINYEGIFKLFK